MELIQQYFEHGQIVRLGKRVVLGYESLKTLFEADELVDDNVMNAFMTILEWIHGHIFTVNAASFPNLPFLFVDEAKNLEKATLIFIPICEDNHWTLAVAEKNSQSITHYDSLPNSARTRRRMKVARIMIRSLVRQLIDYGICRTSWISAYCATIKYKRFECSSQFDTTSCGVIVMNIAKMISEHAHLRDCHFSTSPSSIKFLRLKFTDDILRIALPKEDSV